MDKDAKGKEFKLGDLVSMPIEGEEVYDATVDEVICETYEVIFALQNTVTKEIICPINEMGYINKELNK